jgi:hypothetical protein
MAHFHVVVICQCEPRNHSPAACPCCRLLCMSMSILHFHVVCSYCICCLSVLPIYAACQCCLSKLYVNAAYPSGMSVNVHAACPCCGPGCMTCCMSILHVNAACPSYWSILHFNAAYLCCNEILYFSLLHTVSLCFFALISPLFLFFSCIRNLLVFFIAKQAKIKPSAVTDATMNSTMDCKSVHIKVGVCIMLS